MRLAVLALVGRAIGFMVPMVIAAWFGVQLFTDAFFYALAVPAFLVIVGNTAVGTLLVPTLARRRLEAPASLGPLAVTASCLPGLVALVVSTLTAALLPAVLPTVSGFDAEGRAMTIRFAWALAPTLALIGSATGLRAGLEVSGGYGASALSPLLRSVAQLVVTGALREHGPQVLPIGIGVGSILELSWLAWSLQRTGVSLRPALAHVGEVASSLRGFAAVAAGEGLVALQIVVDKAFASALGVGAVSILEYADRVRLVPQTLLEASLVVVAYNEWARLSAAGDRDGERRAIARALVWVALIASPVLAAMGVGRLAIVHLLFERGAWDPRWSAPTALALGGFLPGVWFSLLGALLVKAQILAGRRRLVLALGVGSFLGNAALDAILAPRLGVFGLTIATTIVTALVSIVSAIALAPRITRRQVVEVGLVLGVTLACAAGLDQLEVRTIAELRFWLAMLPFGGILVVALLLARRA